MISEDLKTQKEKENIYKTILKLIEFQEINQNLDDLVEEINQMRKTMLLEEKKYSIKELQCEKHVPALEKLEQNYKQIKNQLTDVKKAVSDNEEKKKKIKTIKEFKAINKEIDELNKQNAVLENELLIKSEEFELKKEKVNTLKESMDELKTLIDSKKSDLETLIQERKEEINKYNRKKITLRNKINPKLISIFNRIYKHKDKLAIVKVKSQECYGCHMKVPFQTEVDVKKNKKIIYCTNCSRILYSYEEKAND